MKLTKGYLRKKAITNLRCAGVVIQTSGSISTVHLADLIREATGMYHGFAPRNVIKCFYEDEPNIINIPVVEQPIKKKKTKKKQKRLEFVQTNDFLSSPEWRRLRYQALKLSDGKCQLCGRSKYDGIVLNVDHIKNRKNHPELALELSNLQILCADCNHGKGNIDETDWRQQELKVITRKAK